MEKKVFTFYNNFDKIQNDDKEYYSSLDPLERLAIVKKLRMNFYEDNLQGFPRVFEIIETP